MFEGTSMTPFTMPVVPAGGYGGGSGAGNMWGGDWIWILVVFALLFGWGGNGWGGNGGGSGVQGALTRGDLCMDMNFNDLQNGVRNVNDAVNLGFANLNSTICHQQYDTAMLINGVTGAVNNGFSSLNSTICQQQYDTANMLNAMNVANMQNANAANVVAMQNANALQSQLADCCCKNEAGQLAIQNQIIQQTCALTNQMNTNTRDIIDSQNAGTRAILDYLCQEKISDLQNENNALRLAASQERQNNTLIEALRPTPVPAYPAASPCGLGNWSPQVLSNSFGYGYNNGCGCGCGVA